MLTNVLFNSGAQVVWTDTTTQANLGQTTVVPTATPGVSTATLTTSKLNAQARLAVRPHPVCRHHCRTN